jgi:hypothetical protein
MRKTFYALRSGWLLWEYSAFPALTDSSCIPLLLHAIGGQTIPIPAHCWQTADVPPDRMTGYFGQNRRGLIHTACITVSGRKPARRLELRERPRQRSTLVSELCAQNPINSGAHLQFP